MGNLSLLISSALAVRDTVPFTFECEVDGPDSSVDSEDDSVGLDDDDDDSIELSEEEVSLSTALLPVTMSLWSFCQ